MYKRRWAFIIPIYLLLTATSAIIALTLSFFAYKMRKSKSTLIFSLLMFFMSFFACGSFFELLFNDIKTILFWRNFCQIGYLLSIPTLLILVIDYIGRKRLLKPINIGLIYLFAIIGILLRWTDKYHHLMRKDIFLSKGQLY
jgi:diguanylate cyclase